MNRREFLAMTTIGAAGTVLSGAASNSSAESASNPEPNETMTNKRPKLLVFDVNETLLDLKAMKERVPEALGPVAAVVYDDAATLPRVHGRRQLPFLAPPGKRGSRLALAPMQGAARWNGRFSAWPAATSR